MKYLLLIVSLLVCSSVFSRAPDEKPDNSPSPAADNSLNEGDIASYLSYRKLHKKPFITSKKMAGEVRKYSKFRIQLRKAMENDDFPLITFDQYKKNKSKHNDDAAGLAPINDSIDSLEVVCSLDKGNGRITCNGIDYIRYSSIADSLRTIEKKDE